MEKVELGKLIAFDANPGRDAVHIAVAPVVAGEKLWAGYEVGFLDDRTVGTAAAVKVGIVDPYLKGSVRKGEKFYVCLFPNTVTSLRHVWTHPEFVRKEPAHVGT